MQSISRITFVDNSGALRQQARTAPKPADEAKRLKKEAAAAWDAIARSPQLNSTAVRKLSQVIGMLEEARAQRLEVAIAPGIVLTRDGLSASGKFWAPQAPLSEIVRRMELLLSKRRVDELSLIDQDVGIHGSPLKRHDALGDTEFDPNMDALLANARVDVAKWADIERLGVRAKENVASVKAALKSKQWANAPAVCNLASVLHTLNKRSRRAYSYALPLGHGVYLMEHSLRLTDQDALWKDGAPPDLLADMTRALSGYASTARVEELPTVHLAHWGECVASIKSYAARVSQKSALYAMYTLAAIMVVPAISGLIGWAEDRDSKATRLENARYERRHWIEVGLAMQTAAQQASGTSQSAPA